MGDAIRKEGGGLKSEGVFPVISSWPVIRCPDLSTCHRCGHGFPINDIVDGLKILDSKWRVVLLCRECFARVGSAQICSYCFSWFTELEKGLLDCNMCSRRVHRACVSPHHRNFSHSLFVADNFICVDCCPIPQLRRKGFKKSGGSVDRTTCRVSLEDMIKRTIRIAEKKTPTKVKTRENEVKKVTVAKRSSGLKRKALDGVHLVKETSYINLTVPDEKMALSLHQTINGSKRISRSSYPNGLSSFTVPRKELLGYNSAISIIDSNSITHHGKIDISAENKSNLEGRGNSESISTNSPLFKQENGDLMKQIRGCNIGPLEDFSLGDMAGSLKFLDCTDCSSNTGLEFLPCHSLFNTKLMNTMLLAKYRFSDSDGEGSSTLQRKSIDALGPNGFLKKYFRKSWGSGRTMRVNSHSILSNSPLLKQENGNLMKQNMVCSTNCPRDFFLQEKESSLKFLDSIDNSNNANFTLLSCLSLNTCLESTMPVTRYIFTDCDKMGYSKLQRKSIDAIGPGRPMKNYFRKHRDSGRIMQGNSYSILTNSQLFKRKNRVLMKQNRVCFAGCPGDFSLKEQEGFLKFPDSIHDLYNGDPALSPCHTLHACSNSSMALTKGIFCYGDGEGSSKLQRKSIDAIAYRSMKKYFRKHWSCKKIMIGNCESILVDSLLFKKESEDLRKQIKGCNTANLGSLFLNENVSSLQFPDSTNDGSNAVSALLPCHSLNIWSNSTIVLTNCSSCDGDGEVSKELERKPIDEIVSDNMKKYYRKRRDSKRVMQRNSQTISANSPLIKWENVDLMKQTRGCRTSYPGDVYLKNDISPKFPDSTDDNINIDSPLLQFRGLNACSNSKMSLIKYRFGDGDGEECSKLHRRSIDTIGSDGSLKKYFRKRLGS